MGFFSKLFNTTSDGEAEATDAPAANGDSDGQPMRRIEAAATSPSPNAPPVASGQHATSASASANEQTSAVHPKAATADPLPPRVAPRPAAPPRPPIARPQSSPQLTVAERKPPTPQPSPARPVVTPRPTPARPVPVAAGAPSSRAAVPPPAAPQPRPASPAPNIAGPPSQGSLAEVFERLLTDDVDIDSSFDALERAKNSYGPPKPGEAVVDLAEVKQLFGQLAANHMRQLRDFVIELRWGPASSAWLDICRPSVESLRGAAEKLDFKELAVMLQALAVAMLPPTTGPATATIEGARRDAILAAHADLVGLLPATFALDLDRNQREAAILHSLLAQVADVRKITIDKLYAAGLTTLETMLLATPGDIASTTAIPLEVAERIVDRFRRYREETQATTLDPTRAHERTRIAGLLVKLRQENAEYEGAAAGWTKEANERKKERRRAREQTMLEITVLLARLGEVDLVHDLERLPYERKVAEVATFLDRAREKYAPAPPA